MKCRVVMLSSERCCLQCTNAVEEGATFNVAASTTSPDSPSGKLTVCGKQTNGM